MLCSSSGTGRLRQRYCHRTLGVIRKLCSSSDVERLRNIFPFFETSILILQVGMRRNASVESRWICVDKWTLRYSDIHIAYCILPMAYGLWPMIYCLLPVAYCLLTIAYYLLHIAHCLLSNAYCLLLIVYCILPIAYCLLPIAYCLLPIVHARRHCVLSHALIFVVTAAPVSISKIH